MRISYSRALVAAATLPILAGCGGGGATAVGGVEFTGTPVGSYAMLDDTTTTDASTLSYLAFNGDADPSTGSGSLNHVSGAITGGMLAGTINAGRTQIVLSGGGVATITNGASTEYVRVFQTSGTGDNHFGVFGVGADPADLIGSAVYGGQTNLTVTDGSSIYDLSGQVSVEADFGASSVDTRFYNLSGTRNTTQSVTNVGTIAIDGATLSGNRFSGGALSVGGAFTVTGSADLTGTEGQFFGPGDEVGGILLIDDTASGDFSARGVYTAE